MATYLHSVVAREGDAPDAAYFDGACGERIVLHVGDYVRHLDPANATLLTANAGVILELDAVMDRIRIGFPNVFGTQSTTSVWPECYERLFEKVALGPDPEPRTCPWLIEVPSYNPEPDFPEDLVSIVECGAEVTENEFGSWRCAAGHEHVSYDDPARGAYEAEMAFMERQDG